MVIDFPIVLENLHVSLQACVVALRGCTWHFTPGFGLGSAVQMEKGHLLVAEAHPPHMKDPLNYPNYVEIPY